MPWHTVDVPIAAETLLSILRNFDSFLGAE